MKTKYFAALLGLAVPAMMSAVPADPRVRTIENPDGSEVEVRVHGDEFFSFMTDVDCTRILARNESGFVVDRQLNGKSLAFNRENVAMLRAQAIEANPELERMVSYSASRASSIAKMATLDNAGRSNYPTIGEGNRSMVVLVEFSDASFVTENPQDYYTRQLNEPGFSDYGGRGSALDYYKDASNGLYQPQFDVYGPVKIDHTAAYFYEKGGSKHMDVLIKESLTALHDSGEVDFSNYDLDEDGVIDTVFFYYAGYGQADSDTHTIWPHQYDYRYTGATSIRFEGKQMGPYACANELDGYNPETRRQPYKDGSEPWVGGIGTFVHEYGHVLGLPDLYDVAYSEEAITPGIWDVMDGGCYNFNGTCPPLLSSYEQWVCRWLEYTNAEDATHYDLTALGNTENPTAVRVRIPMSANGTNFYQEYFLIEARDNSKWDACFPEPGLMVWRINYNKNAWINNSVNTAQASNVEIVLANGEGHPLFEEGAIYEGAPVTLKPSKNYPLWVCPVISDISYDKETLTGSFDYNMVTPSDVATVLHDNPLAAPDGSRSFTLEWDPVEEADSYLVTVRMVEGGKIIDNYDRRNVGDATTAVVSGISTMYWKLEMEAFVTCVVNGMPSTRTSNVVTFKPSQLEKGEPGAVGSIGEGDIVISGGVGCINAPEGAQVFDMSGKRLKRDGLAPGIYIVTYGGSSSKIVVR